MSEGALKFINIAIVILASCTILTFGFRMVRNMNSTSDVVLEDTNNTVNNMKTAEFSKYNNKTVSGDDIILAVNKYQTQMWVKVYLSTKVGDPVEFRYFPATNYEVINEPDTNDYIDPEKSFTATLSYDVNGFIDGIIFRES